MISKDSERLLTVNDLNTSGSSDTPLSDNLIEDISPEVQGSVMNSEDNDTHDVHNGNGPERVSNIALWRFQ